MRKILLIIVLSVILYSSIIAQDTMIVVSYNVENLFDNRHDTLKQDKEFTYDGMRHWTYAKWQLKMDHIAQVIANCVAPSHPSVLGLCEIENERCVKQLCYKLKPYSYAYVHYESPDVRGIDVALLYDTTVCQVLSSKPVYVNLTTTYTRDILYTKLLFNHRDTIHFFVCHLPSQYGGSAQTQWKRNLAKQTLQHSIDSLYACHINPLIICMGDMNYEPQEDLSHMHNLMLDIKHNNIASHKYKGIWTWLDQFYVSSALYNTDSTYFVYNKPYSYAPKWLLEDDKDYLGQKPFRTFMRYKYNGGYSDHLPVILKIVSK